MTLTTLTLVMILGLIGSACWLVFGIVPSLVHSGTVIRLSRLRDELHELDNERPGTLRHRDVERLDGLIAGHLTQGRTPTYIVLSAALVVLRARRQNRFPQSGRRFEGLGLDHRADLHRIEVQVVYATIRSFFLASPVWFLTGFIWLYLRPGLRRMMSAHKSTKRTKVERRAEAFVVFLGGADFGMRDAGAHHNSPIPAR